MPAGVDEARENGAAEKAFSVEALTHPTKRTLLWIAVAVVLVVGVFFLVGRAAEFDDIVDAVRKADYRWLALCAAGEVVSYGGYILAYRDFAHVRNGPALSTRLAAEVVVVGIGATAIGSTPGGLAVDYWALHEAGASRRDAARRVLGLNTIKWLSLAILAAIGAVATMAGLGTAPDAMAIAWLAVVAIALGLAAVLTSGTPGRTLLHAARRAEGGREGHEELRPLVRVRGEGGVRGRDRRRPLRQVALRGAAPPPGGVAGFPLYWAGDMLCFWVALRAFGVELDLATLVLAYATGYVATGLPLPVGGSGGVEAAMTFALTACGVPLATALLGVVTYRLFEFWLPLLPALAIVPRLKRIESRLAEVAAAGSGDGV